MATLGKYGWSGAEIQYLLHVKREQVAKWRRGGGGGSGGHLVRINYTSINERTSPDCLIDSATCSSPVTSLSF